MGTLNLLLIIISDGTRLYLEGSMLIPCCRQVVEPFPYGTWLRIIPISDLITFSVNFSTATIVFPQ